MTITIITTYGAVTVEGTHWARDSDGDLHVYDEDAEGDDTVATIDAARFVAAAKADGTDYGVGIGSFLESLESRDLERKMPPS